MCNGDQLSINPKGSALKMKYTISSNDELAAKSSMPYPQYFNMPFSPSIKLIFVSATTTPAKPSDLGAGSEALDSPLDFTNHYMKEGYLELTVS